MTDYYLLMPRDGFGVARADPADEEYMRRLSWSLNESGRIELDRSLRWTRDRESPAADWQWALPDIPLLSTRFKDVVEEYRASTDDVQWIRAALVSPGGSEEERWIPHFPGDRDILDPDWTQWGPSGLPTAWYLSPSKMDGVTITTRPQVSGTLIVNNEIMRALRRGKLTGYQVMRARISGETQPAP